MRCLVFALAMIFVGCSTHSQLGSRGPGDSRGSSALPGPETTVVWLDSQGGFPSVGFFDVETIFDETELESSSYVRVASLQATGTSQKALLGVLRQRASQIGANRLLIVKAEEKKEEVNLYSGLENVARFFSGKKPAANRKDEAYTLRIDAIAIRITDDRSTLLPPRYGNDRPTVYRPRRPYDRPTIYRPRRPYDRRSVYRPPRRYNRPPVRPPRRPDDRPPAPPPPPKDDRPPDKAPPSRDDPTAGKRSPPEDDRPSLKRPRLKTHQP